MKLKTRKSIQKRFRVTKSGKMLRRRQYGRHIRSTKSKRQKRKYKTMTTVHSAFAKKFTKLLNI